MISTFLVLHPEREQKKHIQATITMLIHMEVEAHLRGHGKPKGFFTVDPRLVEGDQPDLGSKQHGP